MEEWKEQEKRWAKVFFFLRKENTWQNESAVTFPYVNTYQHQVVSESTHHFLIFCKKFSEQRQRFRKKLKEKEIKVDINSSVKLLDTPTVFPFLVSFIEETGRFGHLKTYLEKKTDEVCKSWSTKAVSSYLLGFVFCFVFLLSFSVFVIHWLW